MSETPDLKQKIQSSKRGLRSLLLQSKLAIRSVFLGRKQKIFILSFQRSGTKSTAMFFREHGYQVCSWGTAKRLDWTVKWLKGDYDSIFNSLDFRAAEVFEDSPWFFPGFYKILFSKFPTYKFVFLERNGDKWFNSMMSHSNQKTLGNTHIHATIYERMDELNALPDVGLFEKSIANGLPLTEEFREHYKGIYRKSIDEMKLFFNQNDPNGKQFFFGHIEDEKVWLQLGAFIGLKIKDGKVFHAHKTGEKKNVNQ